MTATPALAKYADKPISAVHESFIGWLEEQTGYPVDPQTVAIAINLHSTWQKSDGNQKRIADMKARNAAEAVARAERKAAREAARAEKDAATPPAPAPTAAQAKPASIARRRVTSKAGE